MDFLKLIKREGYLPLSYELNNVIGIDGNVILTILIQKYIYLKNREKLLNGKFYCSEKEIERKTGLSADKQKNIITNLSDQGLIDCFYKGYRYFKIYDEKVLNLFDNISIKDDNILSKTTLDMFKELYGKNLPLFTQKRLLAIFNNEDVIQKAIIIASEHNSNNISYVFKILKDWKEKGLLFIEKIEAYLANPTRINNRDEVYICNLNDEDIELINDIYIRSKKYKTSIYHAKENVETIYKMFKEKGYRDKNLIKKAMEFVDNGEVNYDSVENNIDSFIYYAKGYR